MVDLRCSKCGSHEGFLIRTSQGKVHEIIASISTDRIQGTVQVTCTYCNLTWDYVPIALRDKRLEEKFERLTA